MPFACCNAVSSNFLSLPAMLLSVANCSAVYFLSIPSDSFNATLPPVILLYPPRLLLRSVSIKSTSSLPLIVNFLPFKCLPIAFVLPLFSSIVLWNIDLSKSMFLKLASEASMLLTILFAFLFISNDNSSVTSSKLCDIALSNADTAP